MAKKAKRLRTDEWRAENGRLGHPINPELKPGAGSPSQKKKSPSLMKVGIAIKGGWPKDAEGHEIKPEET